MTDIHHQCHEDHLKKRNPRNKEPDCQILSRTSIDKQTHKNRPPCGISFFRIHHSKRNPDKQVSCQHRDRIRKRLFKCIFITVQFPRPSTFYKLFSLSLFHFTEVKCVCIKNTRLGGVEPPHMPPEGIALSTELQTYNLYHSKILTITERIIYISTYAPKSKEVFYQFFSISFSIPVFLPQISYRESIARSCSENKASTAAS